MLSNVSFAIRIVLHGCVLCFNPVSEHTFCHNKVAVNDQALAKAGYFIMSSLLLKINRIIKADNHFIDAAKQVKPGTDVDSEMQIMIYSSAPLLAIRC